MTTLKRWRPKPLQDLTFVLDLAVPLEWYDNRWSSQYTGDVLARLRAPGAVVPAVWPAQLADAIHDREQTGRSTTARTDWYFANFNGFHIALDREALVRAWADILTLARTHAASVSDAAYLELAIRRKLPLATIDPTLARHATAAGVPIYSP